MQTTMVIGESWPNRSHVRLLVWYVVPSREETLEPIMSSRVCQVPSTKLWLAVMLCSLGWKYDSIIVF